MSFCDFLGLDSDLIFDIVSNAAGASQVFVKYFAEMRRGKWVLGCVDEVEGFVEDLVSFLFRPLQIWFFFFSARRDDC